MTPARRFCLPLLASAIVAVQPSIAAQSPTSPPTVPLSDGEFRALVAPAIAAAQADDCPRVFAVIDPALSRLAGRNRNAAQLLRLPCLIAAARSDEAQIVYREVVESDPRSPLIRSVGVIVALSAGDYVEAGTRLASLAEDDPAALTRLTGTAVRGITQALTETREFKVRDRLFIALARSDWQPQDRPEMRDGFAVGAIDALVGTPRASEADALLPRITAPEMLAGMAIERHYEPLWPAIESRMGPHTAFAV
ncbi:MAG: hypothetical protein ABW128_20500, partial [Rhizorhabdus sp.]